MIPRIRIQLLFAGLLWSAFIFSSPPAAHAGQILGAPAYIGLNSGLVGSWTMNGSDSSKNSSGILTVIDSSGNGNKGVTPSAAGSPVPVSGKIGQALDFDGTNDNFSVGDINATDGASQLTISVWVYQNSLSDFRSAVSKYSGASNHFSLGSSAAVAEGNNDIHFNLNNSEVMTSGNVHQAGRWEHWVAWFDGTRAAGDRGRIYLNGVRQTVSASALQTTTANNSNAIRIGSDSDQNSCCFWNGKIDEVRIYTRALSDDEVKRLYKIGSTEKIGAPNKTGTLGDGLVAWWTMDGTDTSLNNSGILSALDRSGNRYHARSGGPAGASAAVRPAISQGKVGQAIDFDGANDTMFASAASLGQLTSMTISAWIYPRDFNPAINIAGILERVSSGIEWGIALDDTDVNDGLTFLMNCSIAPLQVFAANSIVLNRWQHVVVTWSGGCTAASVTFYVDNTIKTRSGANGSGSAPNDSGLGFELSSDSSDTYYLNGKVDDLRLYNRVLSADEIKRLYKMGDTFRQGVASASDSLSQGLVGWWTFDGKDTARNNSGILTANDITGTGNTAKSTSAAAAPATVPGKIGQAFNFDGSNDIIDTDAVDSESLNNLGPMTVSVWMYPDTLPTDTSAICNRWILATHGSGSIEWYVQSGTQSLSAFTDTGILKTKQWQHVAVVWDGSNQSEDVQFYYNGSPTANVSGTDMNGRTSENGSWVELGNCTLFGPQPFDGALDDARIYNRMLTADEIKRLYNMGR